MEDEKFKQRSNKNEKSLVFDLRIDNILGAIRIVLYIQGLNDNIYWHCLSSHNPEHHYAKLFRDKEVGLGLNLCIQVLCTMDHQYTEIPELLSHAMLTNGHTAF